ncbi:PREDICTED: uncharacterized protein LOC109169222 [Ipomoea nil]|uniref:uncharacterized protein LOC109169222 n=1 Tax=Ipomoea nil TaxID=35883 RepID=UPI000901BDB6|nr:PREDICTED: uncharacterized protein LOC109169222 [Ipomoea nil]
MAKMLANRMKTLMGDLISESQSAFIPGRLITDNILVAAEVGHYLNRKQCGVVGWSAQKLDMSKAYDRMEWTFLERMLIEASVIKQCLVRYDKLSGQVVNYNKSNICFSRNTHEEDRTQVASCLEVEQATNFEKYLGLPSFVGRNKRDVFSYVEEKISQRIGSWSKKLLSQAGKEVLLKSVAQSMPTFSMSVFLLPETICQSIERTMNKFWWENGRERGIHWKAWDRLCFPKKFGGLGFKELRAFNLAMLGKQACRFLTNPGSLAARIYKARYYPTTSFVDATIGNCPSFCWRSIMAAHAIVTAGVRRRIGNGQTTLIWGHPWLPDNPSPLVQTDIPEELREARIAGLIDPRTNTWDPLILSDLFILEDVNRIIMIPVSPDYDDSWYWMGDPKGTYTVKTTLIGVLLEILRITQRVEVDPICPMCALDHEDVLHALVFCEYSTLIWNITQLPITNIATDSFSTWLMGALAVLTEEKSRLLVAVLYHIWRGRNSAVWKGAMMRPADVARGATASMQAYGSAHHRQALPDPTPMTGTKTHGNLRCYVDAGFQQGTGEATYGIVLISQEESFIAAKNGKSPFCFSPLMAEALAYKEALSWLLERNITSVCLLTDCMVLRSAVQQQNTPIYSYVGVMVDQCRTLMSLFSHISLNYVPR